MYKALEEIGNFKKGDIVPDEQAEIWAKMYDKSPVEKIDDSKEIVPEAKKEEAKEKAASWQNDYLNQNAKTVINSIKNDDLEKKDILKLIKIESEDKHRTSVLDALQDKLEAL